MWASAPTNDISRACVGDDAYIVPECCAFNMGKPLFFIGAAKEIICSGLVKVRKLEKNGGGDIIFSGFVFGITGLGHSQKLRHLLLCKIPIFPQISDAFVHSITSYILYNNLKQIIDI